MFQQDKPAHYWQKDIALCQDTWRSSQVNETHKKNSRKTILVLS